MLKTVVGLEDVAFFRPWEFAGQVELQVGQAAVRRWPTRVCDGFEISLLVGPSHDARILGRKTKTPGKVTFVQLPGTVWSADEAVGGFLSLEVAREQFERLVSEWPRRRPGLLGPSQVVLPTLLESFWQTHAVLRKQRDATTRTEALVQLVGAAIAALTERSAPAADAGDGVARARDAIHDDPKKAPTIDALAAVAGMNALALVRAFRKRYGVGPAEYRRKLRVAIAQQMLRSGRAVVEVVAELGFCDDAELCRAFTGGLGVAPASYGATSAARLV